MLRPWLQKGKPGEECAAYKELTVRSAGEFQTHSTSCASQGTVPEGPLGQGGGGTCIQMCH